MEIHLLLHRFREMHSWDEMSLQLQSQHTSTITRKHTNFFSERMRSDITIAMEIFEHLDADKLSGAIARSRASSRFGMLFASVPYQEKHPLYHHDKPFGHKQSFDDAKVYECFGDEAIWTNFNNLWYLIFMSEGLETQGSVSFEHFANLTRKTFDARMASESERVGA